MNGASYNKYNGLIAGILIGAIVTLLIVLLTIKKPVEPVGFQATLDSLSKVSAAIELKQKKVDTLIASYNGKISDLDFKLNNIKEKTVLVREYYHEVSKQVSNYDGTQIDSFLRKRYSY